MTDIGNKDLTESGGLLKSGVWDRKNVIHLVANYGFCQHPVIDALISPDNNLPENSANAPYDKEHQFINDDYLCLQNQLIDQVC